MNLVGYTTTALSRNDITDTPTDKNVVDGAIVELKDYEGNLVTIYDDINGTNPETQKTCDTDGQCTFFAEDGDYILEVNGKEQFISLGINNETVKDLTSLTAWGDRYVGELTNTNSVTLEGEESVFLYNGHYYENASNASYPLEIAAGTVPSEPDYKQTSLLSEQSSENVVLNSGLSMQEFSENRPVNFLLSVAENVSALQNKVLLQKLRSDYPEFCVYTPMTIDGQYWHRWLFTNRFNIGNGGATRMINCSLAALNPSVSQGNVSANNVSETTASPTTVVKSSSDGTQTGTWVGPTTILTTTDVLYSETIGDVLTYTVTGAERLVLRGLMAGNGGVGKVQVFDGGVEIPESNYLTPSDRLVSFLATGVGNTTMHYPIAEGLDSAKTYTVEVRVHTSNPVGGRVYQAGLLGYDDIAYNAVGYHGLFADAPAAGEDSNVSLTSGTAVVYQVTNSTKMTWKFVSSSVNANFVYEVYDGAGSLVDSGSINGFTASLTSNQSLLASDLDKGTYYFKIMAGKTKNASSSAYRMYDVGAIGYDQTTAGELGVDDFDNFDMPDIISDPNNGSEYMIIGSGNLELAIGVRRPSDPVGVQEFVGGIHAFETPDPISVYVDGALYDFAGSADLSTIIGSDIDIELDTTLLFPEDSQPFMDVNYKFSFSQSGYQVKTDKAVTADCVIHNDFDIMFNCPNTAATNQGLSVGGGFELVAANQNYLINNYDNSGTFIKPKQGSVAFSNREFTALCYYNAPPSYPSIFASGGFNQGNDYCLMQDRTDRTLKWYTRSFSGDETNGVETPAGTAWSTTKVYRAMKGNFKNLVGL